MSHFCHFQDNLTHYLQKQKVSKKIRNKIYKRIFVGEESIIESKDETEFEERRLNFEQRYSDFFEGKYLKTYLTKLLENVKIPNWRSEGKIPINKTNNDAECLNSIMKRRARKRLPQKLTRLVEMIINMYKSQENYVEGAFRGRGKYMLAHWMEKRFLKKEAYNNMKPEKQEQLLRLFYEGPQKKEKQCTSAGGELTLEVNRKQAKKIGQTKRVNAEMGNKRRRVNTKNEEDPLEFRRSSATPSNSESEEEKPKKTKRETRTGRQLKTPDRFKDDDSEDKNDTKKRRSKSCPNAHKTNMANTVEKPKRPTIEKAAVKKNEPTEKRRPGRPKKEHTMQTSLLNDNDDDDDVLWNNGKQEKINVIGAKSNTDMFKMRKTVKAKSHKEGKHVGTVSDSEEESMLNLKSPNSKFIDDILNEENEKTVEEELYEEEKEKYEKIANDNNVSVCTRIWFTRHDWGLFQK